jgi:hypothetical protein
MARLRKADSRPHSATLCVHGLDRDLMNKFKFVQQTYDRRVPLKVLIAELMAAHIAKYDMGPYRKREAILKASHKQ